MKERSSLVFCKRRRIEINGAEPIRWPCSHKWRISKLKFTVMECHVRLTNSKARMINIKTQSMFYGATSTDGEHKKITMIC
eukprot:14828609-Heterocapsa_arctica.AAC.1